MFPIQTRGPEPFGAAYTYMKDLVIQDPKWDFRTFDYDEDVTRAVQAGSTQLDVPPGGLDTFLAGGRKLLLSHGWADGLIPTLSTVNFYGELVSHVGAKKADGTRLFLIPGMGHCAGGEGPFVFDPISTLDKWVDTGHAPERIVVSTHTIYRNLRGQTRHLHALDMLKLMWNQAMLAHELPDAQPAVMRKR